MEPTTKDYTGNFGGHNFVISTVTIAPLDEGDPPPCPGKPNPGTGDWSGCTRLATQIVSVSAAGSTTMIQCDEHLAQLLEISGAEEV